jgi:hypothetical protein
MATSCRPLGGGRAVRRRHEPNDLHVRARGARPLAPTITTYLGGELSTPRSRPALGDRFFPRVQPSLHRAEHLHLLKQSLCRPLLRARVSLPEQASHVGEVGGGLAQVPNSPYFRLFGIQSLYVSQPRDRVTVFS